MTSLTLDIDHARRVGIADAKANLSGLIAEVERTGEPYVVMRYNRPAAIIGPMPQERSTARTARGLLHHLAGSSEVSLEGGAMARALVEKHANR